MNSVKLFRCADLNLDVAGENPPEKVCALVNVSNSNTLGAGIGIFGKGCDIEWTVTYDEVLFIHKGNFKLQVGNFAYKACPGDTLFIPADTPLRYQSDEDVIFFYAVSPVAKSPSTGKPANFPTTKPEPVSIIKDLRQ